MAPAAHGHLCYYNSAMKPVAPTPEQASSDARRIFLFVYLLVALFVGRLLLPFAGAIIAAAVAASLLGPLYRWACRKSGRDNLAAFGTIVVFVITVAIPLVTSVAVFVNRLPTALRAGQRFFSSLATAGSVRDHVGQFLARFGVKLAEVEAQARERTAGILNELLGWVSRHAPDLFGAGGAIILSALVFLVTLFLFLKDGRTLKKWLMELSPLDDELETKLGDIFVAYSRALVFGSFFTASLQGLVAWIAYALMGVPESFLLGVTTTICSFIPAVGSALVWGPVALYLFLYQGSVVAGVILILVGIFIIGGIDSLVKPFFYRSSYKMHPFLIFLSMLGGLFWLGFWGLLLGPVMTAFFLTLHAFSMEQNLLGHSESTTE